ncbi:restriction endonuclease subunit S [Vibrio alginolyticus]
MVPNGWEVSFLKDVTLKIQDGNYGAEYPKKNELVNSGVPFLTSKVLGGDGRINENKFDYITPDKHKKLKKAQITKDDVLFTNRGANVGVIGLADEKLMDANIGPQLTLIRADRKQLESKFLYFALKGDYFQRQINGQDSGSAMNFFGIKATEKFKVAIPPLPEQRKIAKVLSTWDKAISTTEKLIETSKQQKKALMQQLLTGKKRLVNPETGKAFEGEWEEVKLGELGQTFTGLTGKTKEDFGSGAKYIPYINIFNNSSVNTAKLEKVHVGSEEKQNVVQFGDVFFTTSSETPDEVGMSSVMLSEPEEPIYLNSFCFGFRPNDTSTVIPEFMQYLLRSSRVRRSISVLAQGATRYNLSKVQLLKINLLLPTSDEQKKIASVLTIADNEIEVLEAKLAHFKQEKKALMQQLLTGKRRVKVDEDVAA